MSINSFLPCLFTSPNQELPASTDKFLNRTVLSVAVNGSIENRVNIDSVCTEVAGVDKNESEAVI